LQPAFGYDQEPAVAACKLQRFSILHWMDLCGGETEKEHREGRGVREGLAYREKYDKLYSVHESDVFNYAAVYVG